MARGRARAARDGGRDRVRFRHLRARRRALNRGAPRCRAQVSTCTGRTTTPSSTRRNAATTFAARIAVVTAILSTVGALFAYQAGATQNDALLHKNEAAIRKTEASDQWNFYQAKSGKQNLAELGAALATGEAAERMKREAERYKAEKAEIQKVAERLEAEGKAANERSEASMHVHHRWAQAMTLVQIAISLAAITLLTRRRWLQYAAYGTGAAGGVLALLAALHV